MKSIKKGETKKTKNIVYEAKEEDKKGGYPVGTWRRRRQSRGRGLVLAFSNALFAHCVDLNYALTRDWVSREHRLLW